MQKILAGLKGLGRTKLVALGVVAALLLMTLGVLAFYSGSNGLALLYGGLDISEAAEMVDDLGKAHITAKTSPDGRTIYVPKSKVASARLVLAKAGLPSGGAVGYELFDKSGTLTSTQFEQGIGETRAMEGELERSIRLINGVRNVRVHLVLPHRDLFSTQTNPSQASVILDVGRVGRVSPSAIAAIQNLVAAAVPGLQAHSISVVDTRGDVLAKPGDPDSLAEQESTLEKQRHSEEQRLSQAVEDILTPTLGMGHVRARAAVTMNTDLIRETEESYDPNQQVLRSQTTSTDKSVNTEASQDASVNNNLPNADAGQANRSGSSDDRVEETNNYEIGKRVRVIDQRRPRISRISLAVMVDGTYVQDKTGKTIWKPLDDKEIQRLSKLVQTVIGFDKERGDQVNVISMPFKVEGRDTFTHDVPFFLRKDVMIYYAEWALPILLLIGALLIFFKPLLRRVQKTTDKLTHKEDKRGAEEDHDDTPSLEEVVAGMQNKMPTGILENVFNKIETNPDEAVYIIRNWLLQPENNQNNPPGRKG
ncbi:flagellar M-ring protein FliF (plasmid) [Aristophania vespae]|uniref:Flagellar M-ring protein n=1 Tax=Aristophania vespae TaxID=2697033 RepID=A0A6P1NNN8_9PROT|nr:flagellar basal-body MS-ring/collar protein FliF [Aristophania vespae]QHI96471.1 flagellar M-ring protein FliF [Aristophania vespae]